MEGSLNGVRAVVTGAGRGIGAAIATGLAASGARVLIADIDEAAASATAERIGPRARSIRVDVSDRMSVRAAIADAVSAFGGLDAMFNNAGIVKVTPFMDVTEDDFRVMMEVNALGALIGMQEAARQMRRQGAGGSIVNTASVAGKQGYDFFTQYCASKFAVIGMTQAAAKDMGKDNIRVNAICPGIVDTPMWAFIDESLQSHGVSEEKGEAFQKFAAQAVLGRPSTAEDLVGIARFLVSKDAAFITGQSIVVDGGIMFS